MRNWWLCLNFIVLLFFASGVNAQQLIITDLSSRVGPVTIDQLTQVTVANPFAEPVVGALQARLMDRSNIVIAKLNSLPFSLGSGQQIAPFDIPWLRQPDYGTSPFAADFARTGVLNFGEFIICFEFTDQQGSIRGNSCSERTSEPLLNMSLIYPFDEQTVEEQRPVLSWEQVALPQLNSQDLSYSLVLAQQNPGQSTAEALERNVSLLRLENLRDNSLLYPVAAPELTTGMTYAWMVRAYLRGRQLVSSQQWEFTIATKDTAETVPPPARSFTMLQTKLSSRYQVFKDDILIGFDNNEGVEVLDYSITEVSNGRKAIKKLPVVEGLHPGLNTIRISLTGLPLSTKKEYLLEVKTPRRQSYFLLFKVLKDKQ